MPQNRRGRSDDRIVARSERARNDPREPKATRGKWSDRSLRSLTRNFALLLARPSDFIFSLIFSSPSSAMASGSGAASKSEPVTKLTFLSVH